MYTNPLIKYLSEDEIRTAAERWLGLLAAERITWTAHAGFPGDTYPVENDDELHLSLALATCFNHPCHYNQSKQLDEARELLTQFADKMRSIAERSQQMPAPRDVPVIPA